MPTYRVYATRWDTGGVVEEIPAKGLQFSMPLSDHGECSFNATVSPGSVWRPAVSAPVTGILVARDDEPVWTGWLLTDDQQAGSRTFAFGAYEWLKFYAAVPAVAHDYADKNDHYIFRDLISRAAADVTGQDVGIVMDSSTMGDSSSDLTIEEWDHPYVEQVVTELANTEGGPEWYVQAGGTLSAPTRRLVLGDRLGLTTSDVVLEYVEDTAAAPALGAMTTSVLSSLLPTVGPVTSLERRGGNVLVVNRTRDGSRTVTATLAVGAGQEAVQLTKSAQSDRLLAAGFPRLTRIGSYTDVTNARTLQRHANADLAASCGVLTGYTLVTLEGDPEWRQVPRGSTVRVILDTDVYGGARPVDFTTRVQNITVAVPDDGGPAQVAWDVADVLEV